MAVKYVHTNLVAKDWQRLSVFYQEVLGCIPVPPERQLSGDWLDKATGLNEAAISGIHLRLPGYGTEGPTLELFQYDSMPDRLPARTNAPGFAHLAFAVDDVAATAQLVFDRGGRPIGKYTEHKIPGVGVITFQYVTDPEGNIIELQHWKKHDIHES